MKWELVHKSPIMSLAYLIRLNVRCFGLSGLFQLFAESGSPLLRTWETKKSAPSLGVTGSYDLKFLS
jgi:hypothetical protein